MLLDKLTSKPKKSPPPKISVTNKFHNVIIERKSNRFFQ